MPVLFLLHQSLTSAAANRTLVQCSFTLYCFKYLLKMLVFHNTHKKLLCPVLTYLICLMYEQHTSMEGGRYINVCQKGLLPSGNHDQ